MAYTRTQAETNQALADKRLWLKVDATGMTRLSELNFATELLEQAQSNLGRDNFSPDDLLVLQYLPPKRLWIIYPATNTAKAKLLSMLTLGIGERSYDVRDF